MRAVIFYEGKTEEQMMLWFFRKHFFINITYSPIEFKEYGEDNTALLIYCEGSQNVISTAIKFKHFYDGNEQILLVRDLEEIPCYQELNNDVIRLCPEIVAKGKKSNLFAKPQFEDVYFANESLLRDTIESHLQSDISKNSLSLDENIRQLDRNKPGKALRELFKNYDSHFDKTDFATRFFSRFDFSGADHHYFNRLKLLFEN